MFVPDFTSLDEPQQALWRNLLVQFCKMTCFGKLRSDRMSQIMYLYMNHDIAGSYDLFFIMISLYHSCFFNAILVFTMPNNTNETP